MSKSSKIVCDYIRMLALNFEFEIEVNFEKDVTELKE